MIFSSKENMVHGPERIIERGLYVSLDGGDLSASSGVGLTPINRVDAGIKILGTTPNFDQIAEDGARIARRKLRGKIPDDLELVGDVRLSEYEESSLKRHAAMTSWADEYPGVELQEGELVLLNGSTVDCLVLYMQRKVLGVNLSSDETDALKARQPKLPEGSENLPEGEFRRLNWIISDRSAFMLLQAMDAKLPGAK